jgi:hypothetical protein
MAGKRRTKNKQEALYRDDKGDLMFGFAGEPWSEEFKRPSFLDKASYQDVPARMKSVFNAGARQALYPMIDSLPTPFNMDGPYIDISDTIILCQKAYFGVSIFRQTVDIMTEFSNSEVLFKGGTTQSRAFFQDWWEKIDGFNLGDKFYREWFRSGNLVLFRMDVSAQSEVIRKMRKAYAVEIKAAEVEIPLKYIILNPAEIKALSSGSFHDGEYVKTLSSYEISKIKSLPQEEGILFNSNLIKNEQGNIQFLRLTPDQTYFIFAKRQDYEPFAVPMFYSVLDDIDLKLQFKKIEKIASRSAEYIILLAKAGSDTIPNPKALSALHDIFNTGTIGRFLVADHTTELEFVIPEINRILGSEKYKQVNDDIAAGLMNIFMGDDKFANSSIKTNILLERINESRRAFLENFLNPEIRRIAKLLGYSKYPKAYMAEVDLQDKASYAKMIAQLMGMGSLTAAEGLESIQNGYLPTPEESVENQKAFKKYRDEGLYEPVLGGSNKDPNQEGGRPTGKGTPQTTQKVKPIGTKASQENAHFYFSLSKLENIIKASSELNSEVQKLTRSKFKIKKLNKNQVEACNGISELIVANEASDKWMDIAKEYVESPRKIYDERADLIDNIMEAHKTDRYTAILLSHCLREKPE